MSPMPHAAVADARMLANACAEALRSAGSDPIFAAILHGSLVLGDFVPGRSDVDVLVLVDEPLSDDELAAVQGSASLRRAEAPHAFDLRVVTRSAALQPTRTPEVQLYVGCHRSGLEIERRCVEPDLLVEFSVVRTHGQSLIGPQPHSVVGHVPASWILEYGDRQLARWQRLTDDQEHAELMVLTACRIWRFAADGVHSSKTEAGRWALARDTSLVAVAEALKRRGGGSGTVGADGIGRVLAVARDAIARHR